DRAALKFEADDDASKFYARLSTSTDRTLYAEYGDPVDADLWFYDFVTNPTIPSTSRATLTLGIPWDEDDDDYIPDPETCFIYERDADGNLTDVTDKFTFSEDDEEIPGWSMKTRVLGTYVLSDTELDIEAINADDEDDDDAAADVTTPDGGKDIPQTGSSDMVNVAVVAAVVSLAAAGAVAFRKVK
ncbi:LPXTG cell wall anchor domain-containing protein, partial [Anaerotruncus rubiinfantis]|uniref:LPXTG cell wall anchor domain-containing protein n=1 Tax=Anaerotruncus rubiinfantis TaxID=1720200 RepID=UPI0011C8A1FB